VGSDELFTALKTLGPARFDKARECRTVEGANLKAEIAVFK
jgi:hypothetical protein